MTRTYSDQLLSSTSWMLLMTVAVWYWSQCSLEFKDHSRPVVETDGIIGFIKRAPTVFGDSWEKICEWRGIICRKEKEKNIAKHHQVFFQFQSMARVDNRKKLKQWAFIQSISFFLMGLESQQKQHLHTLDLPYPTQPGITL